MGASNYDLEAEVTHESISQFEVAVRVEVFHDPVYSRELYFGVTVWGTSEFDRAVRIDSDGNEDWHWRPSTRLRNAARYAARRAADEYFREHKLL